MFMKIFDTIKMIAVLCIGTAFVGCSSNHEYAYNEKTTSIFLDQMRQIDETDSSFMDTTKVYSVAMGDSIMLSTKAENLVKNAQMDLDNLKDLQPSEEAAAFHNGVVKYLQAISDYGQTAKKLTATKVLAEKQAVVKQLALKYEALNKQPDQVLAIQKAYLGKVGLQPK